MTKQLVIIRGIPGSGKTTAAKKLAAIGYDHHEADHYFEVDGRYNFDGSKLKEAHAQCLSRTVDSMRAGRNCVVANTFIETWEMSPYAIAAHEYGYTVLILEMRNRFKSVHDVPEHVVNSMIRRFRGVPSPVIINIPEGAIWSNGLLNTDHEEPDNRPEIDKLKEYIKELEAKLQQINSLSTVCCCH